MTATTVFSDAGIMMQSPRLSASSGPGPLDVAPARDRLTLAPMRLFRRRISEDTHSGRSG